MTWNNDWWNQLCTQLHKNWGHPVICQRKKTLYFLLWKTSQDLFLRFTNISWNLICPQTLVSTYIYTALCLFFSTSDLTLSFSNLNPKPVLISLSRWIAENVCLCAIKCIFNAWLLRLVNRKKEDKIYFDSQHLSTNGLLHWIESEEWKKAKT